MKWAMTLDGRIAAASGDSRWVSSEESRHYVHTLRGRYMGIMAGIGTVMADNPMLNCRIEGFRQPVRVITDSHASLPEDSAIAMSAKKYRTVLAHTADAPHERLEMLRGYGIGTMECAVSENGMIDLDDLMTKLGAMGINSVLVEGGAELNWSLLSGGLADEYYIFAAPKIIGGKASKGPVGGSGLDRMADAFCLDIESVTASGKDIMIHAFPEGRFSDVVIPDAGRDTADFAASLPGRNDRK